MKLDTTDPMAKLNRYDVSELEDVVYEHLTSDDEEESPLLIFGAPGIGKTAILREAINRTPDGKQWRLVVKTLSTETADNFFLPKYSDDISNQKATDIPKDWLPLYKSTGDKDVDQENDRSLGKGLLFIDELSRANPNVLNVCLSLVHERIFNGYKVGSGWKIICASNRPEDEIVGQADISNALLSRFGIIYFEPSAEGWSKWAVTQPHISPLFLSWIQMPKSETLTGGKYFYWDANEEGSYNDKIQTFCMPRTWDKAFRYLAKKHPKKNLQGFNILEMDSKTIGRRLGMFIPSEAVEHFLGYLNTVDVLGDFNSALNAIWHGVGKFSLTAKQMRNITLPLMQFVIGAHSNTFPTGEEFDHFATWLVDLDSDQAASYALDILLNTFGEELGKEKEPMLYQAAHRYKELKDSKETKLKNRIELYDQQTKKWCKRWGWKSLLDTPDWYEGFTKLGEKYGETFNNTKINGIGAYN